jgi:hypothetical protein
MEVREYVWDDNLPENEVAHITIPAKGWVLMIKNYNGAEVRWSNNITQKADVYIPAGEARLLCNALLVTGVGSMRIDGLPVVYKFEAGKQYFMTFTKLPKGRYATLIHDENDNELARFEYDVVIAP